jgi:hypothetical protein
MFRMKLNRLSAITSSGGRSAGLNRTRYALSAIAFTAFIPRSSGADLSMWAACVLRFPAIVYQTVVVVS